MTTQQTPIIRPIFFALLLANVAFFAWVQQMPPGSAEREPARLLAQMDADKVKLVTPSAVPAKSAAPASAVMPTAESALPDLPVPAPIVDACRAYSGVVAGAARALQAELAQMTPPLKVALPQGKETNFWVFIPPLTNHAAAEKKLSELRQLGVEDAFLMQDKGPQQFSISLAVFRSEALAEKYLADLNKRGVRSARMAARERAELEDKEKLGIEITGNPEVLAQIEKEHKALSGVAASDCKAP